MTAHPHLSTEQKYRIYQCQRYGHDWVGLGYGRSGAPLRCKRCGCVKRVRL